MKYEIEARVIGECIRPANISLKERGLGRFFVTKDDRRIYRNRAERLAREYSGIIYYPLALAGQTDVSIISPEKVQS